MRQNIALFFFFGIAGALCDRVWVVAGTMNYTGYDPAVQPQPWWIPLQYGVMGLVAVHAIAFITRYLVRRDAPPPRDLTASLAISASWFVMAELGGGLFDKDYATLVAATLLAVWLLRIVFQRPGYGQRTALLAVTVILAIAGTLGEYVLVRTHVMEYTRPALLGALPWWIPTLWMQAGFLARDIGRAWFGGR
jgi:hypothetical protein